MTFHIIQQTETSAVVKFTATDTLDLSVDLLSSTMELTGGLIVPKVNINFITWWVSLGEGDNIVVSRSGTEIIRLYENGQMDFAGNGYADNVANDQDITVTINGTGGCFLVLRKIQGYTSKIQPWTYGPYDNEASTGS